MNFYFLVEGRRTEKKVYRAWLQHGFPSLRPVEQVQDLTKDHFLIVSGNGYPACLDRIDASLADIRAW